MISVLFKGNDDVTLFTDVQIREPELVKRIIAQGADVNALRKGKSILYQAVETGNFKIIKILLEAGADPDIGYGDSLPMHDAIHSKEPVIASILLNYGARMGRRSRTARGI